MPKTVEIFREPTSQQEMARAQQQQALAQAMLASGQSPDDMFSQWNRMPIVPQYGIGQGLTQLGSALAGAYINKQAGDKITKVQEREKAAAEKAKAEAMARMMQKTVTGAAQPGPYASGYVTEGSQESRQKSHGEMLADAMMAAEAGVPKEVIDAYLKANEAYTLGDTRYLANQPVASNERPLDELAKLKDDLNNGRIGLTDYMARRELLTTRSPGVTVNTGDAKYESEFSKQLAQSDAAQLTDYRKQAEAGRNMVKTIDELSKRSPKALSGGGAESRAQIANWLEGWTGVNVVDPEVLKNSQVFNATASKMILDSLGGSLGAGVSNADVQFIRNTVPQLEYSKAARDELMNYLRDRASQNIDVYNRAREYGEKHGGLKGFESFPVNQTDNKPKNSNLTRNPDGTYTYKP